MPPDELLHPTPQGLYCPPGDFYVDPVRPVDKAVITHGHADHARAGHGAVLATPETLAIMAVRYGEDFTGQRQALGYGEGVTINGVDVSLVPAGHVLGSAQAVITHKGTRIVVSGDYKRRPDPTCALFEPVPCDVFVTEATFALPVFRHPPTAQEVGKLLTSLGNFPDRTHLVGVYALGKAQRVIKHLREQGYDRPIYLHGAMEKLCALYQDFGVDLGELLPVARRSKEELAGQIVVAPPSATRDRWSRRFADPVTAFASGWMRVRARARQSQVELPLIISDHADWDELIATIEELAPEHLWVTHGREDALVHAATQMGIKAKPLSLVGYDDEDGDADTDAVAEAAS
ncbi:ligase-associated DNA damage response exonuclease [Pyruvatibacter mobilis]|uniref:ligase-associated DNA damage response exonuclease n=1 Tax=Pyruvatibacter mobilis TaxID=1712261 RepID=UPI003BAD8179